VRARWRVEVTDVGLGGEARPSEVIARVRLTAPAGDRARRLALHYDVIQRELVTHRVLVSLRTDWESGDMAGTPVMLGEMGYGATTLQVERPAGSGWAGFASVLRLGMRHIGEGTDHLLFLLVLLNALDATQKTTAQLSGRFDDLLAGANGDGKFASTQQGIAGSALTAAQRTLARNAIQAWVQDLTPAAANTLMADYGADRSLTRTYVSWATSTDSTVQGSYVRIDGPRVWIEFSVQRGAVFQNSIHYHAIWRDKTRDYGGSLSTAQIEAAMFARQLEEERFRFARLPSPSGWFASR
jgi:hypothetical protein